MSVTLNIFRKFLFYFKSICKSRIKLCFHDNMFSTAENCMETWIILLKQVFILLLVIIYVPPIILDSWFLT